jgi:glutathione synthase/RimK-type ligase-like ATP-grasp enzyme
MKIAIHHRSGSYSDQWIEYCKANNIPYKLVNCYQSDIIQQMGDCDGLMWHYNQNDYKGFLCARQITNSLELSGKKVFPDSFTSWHFDDKVGQKYLLEAINAPLVPSYIFYDKKEALKWCESTTFPKVFKLRGGAGSENVKLVKTKSCGKKLIKRAFGSGFALLDRADLLKESLWRVKRDSTFASIIGFMKSIGRIFVPTELERFLGKNKGYIYFQDFIPDNHFDIRVYVMGNVAFGLKRLVRSNDFRASGSGLIEFEKEKINMECVKLAFNLSEKLNTQSIAFDFISHKNQVMLIEISYASVQKTYLRCPGYWDRQLNWHEGTFRIEHIMLANFLEQLQDKQQTVLQQN